MNCFEQLEKLYFKNFKNISLNYWLILGCGLVDENILYKTFDFLNVLKDNPNSQRLDNIYQKYYDDIHSRILDFCETDLSFTNIKNMLEIVMLIDLLENAVEDGYNYINILSSIKTKYKENYFEIIKNADKANLSTDARRIKSFEKNVVYDDCVKRYLVLKKWHNILHYEFLDNLNKFITVCKKFMREGFEDSYYRFFYVIDKIVYNKFKNSFVNIKDLKYVILCELYSPIKNNFGGKAFGLAKLYANGFKIPETYVIFVNCNNFDLNVLDKNKKYAVRSSANIEDGENKSFAGMFDSFLNVSFDDLLLYIQKVKDSVNNNKVKTYLKNTNSTQPQMAVIIQEYKEPDIAGVWLGNNVKSGILEWVYGNGEKLVSGRTTPNTEIWNNKTNEPNFLKINNSYIGKTMLNAQKILYKNNKKLSDIEWCVINNELIFLQFRPVTKTVKIKSRKTKLNEIKGIACSPGIVTGKVRFVEKLEDVKNWNKDDILYVSYTSPEWIDLMIKAKGIISVWGGFLYHAGIVAREFDIPCVCGIGDKISELNGKVIELNGETGIIKLKQNL